MKDTYKTIKAASEEVLFKDRNSKFYGYGFPVTDEEQIKKHLEHLKKEHYQARHWCYAWVLGKRYEQYRANDDGEPSNSAGAPIHGQIQSFDLTNTLVVVVRYFGGTKLGVGGLINAYRTAAKMALENASIEERTIDTTFRVQFEYPLLNKVMRLIRDLEVNILHQEMTLDCRFDLSIRQKESQKVIQTFKEVYGLAVTTEEDL
ncbi:MAG: YigZ family protein [Dokdonia sp.]|jgi:uncharacterized YigZ family protein